MNPDKHCYGPQPETWGQALERSLEAAGESLEDILALTFSCHDQETLEHTQVYGPVPLDDRGARVLLDASLNAADISHTALHAWTKRRVYVSGFYDHIAHWVSSIPRDPSDEKPEHIGNE